MTGTQAARAADDWAAIHERDCPLHLIARAQPLSAETIARMLAGAPAGWRIEGAIRALPALLSGVPDDLRRDVIVLARRFAALMAVTTLRIRLESVTGDACTKFHADYTDVRLITTYAGPGTDYRVPGDGEDSVARVPCGWIGLFKGRDYGERHPPCIHRSPPIAGIGTQRLVLVIDTPLKS